MKRLRLPALSVNTRIIIPFLVAIIVVAGIGVFTVTRLVAGSVQERLHNQLLDSANAASNSIVDIERQHLAVLRLMVFTEGVDGAIQARDLNALDSWLRPIAANARIDEFMIYDAAGEGLLYLRRITDTQYEVMPPKDVQTWTGVQRILRNQSDALGDKYVDVEASSESVTFFISAPVLDENDRVVGGIAVGIRGNTLVQRVSEQALSAVAFLNEDRVIATTFRGEGVDFTRDYRQISAETRVQTPIRNIDLASTNYAVLYAPFRLRDTEIGLMMVGLPGNFIADRSSTSRNLVGMLFLGLFAAITVIGLVISRTITSPINRLVNVTRSIRAGDLSKRVGLQSRDELGDLSTSFDAMTDQLVNSNQRIRHLYREQVQETARRDAVLAGISDPVFVQDLSGKNILYNLAAEALMKETALDAVQHQAFLQLLHEPRQLTQAQVVSFARRFFSTRATPVVIRNGTLIGHVIVFHDITELIESEQLKDELMLQFSHELRTPLSAIRGYVELVKLIDGSNLSERSTDFINNAVDGIETLERMINQSIVVSQIISNRFTLEMDDLDLNPILEDLYQGWKPRMESRSLVLTSMLPERALWIMGDERYIRDVIDHLLLNAYSYTLEGGQIQLQAQIEIDCVRVSVIDTGVGIDEDEIERVFDRMYRGQSADAGPTDARGLGLGLYIARHVVHAHGGEISLTSKLERGTTVSIRLPLQTPPQRLQ